MVVPSSCSPIPFPSPGLPLPPLLSFQCPTSTPSPLTRRCPLDSFHLSYPTRPSSACFPSPQPWVTDALALLLLPPPSPPFTSNAVTPASPSAPARPHLSPKQLRSPLTFPLTERPHTALLLHPILPSLSHHLTVRRWCLSLSVVLHPSLPSSLCQALGSLAECERSTRLVLELVETNEKSEVERNWSVE